MNVFLSDFENVKKRFSEQLKKKTKENRISYRLLASKVGVTASAIALYANGDRFPKDEKVFLNICNEVGISINDILKNDLEEKIEKLFEQQQNIIKQEKHKLYNEILEKQGDLLYTTLSEECAELIQACSKIRRKKYLGENFKDEVDNLLEEINDVEFNITLIKEQLTREPNLEFSKEDINEQLKKWDIKKMQKLKKIFLDKKEKKDGNE